MTSALHMGGEVERWRERVDGWIQKQRSDNSDNKNQESSRTLLSNLFGLYSVE